MRLLTKAQLKERGIRYCNMHLYRLEQAGKFPRRVKLTNSKWAQSFWPEDEINRFIADRIAAREAIDSIREVTRPEGAVSEHK